MAKEPTMDEHADQVHPVDKKLPMSPVKREGDRLVWNAYNRAKNDPEMMKLGTVKVGKRK